MIRKLNKNQLRSVSGGLGDNDFYYQFPDGKISVFASNDNETTFTWTLFKNMASALEAFPNIRPRILNHNSKDFQESMRKKIEQSDTNRCIIIWFETLIKLNRR